MSNTRWNAKTSVSCTLLPSRRWKYGIQIWQPFLYLLLRKLYLQDQIEHCFVDQNNAAIKFRWKLSIFEYSSCRFHECLLSPMHFLEHWKHRTFLTTSSTVSHQQYHCVTTSGQCGSVPILRRSGFSFNFSCSLLGSLAQKENSITNATDCSYIHI